MLARRGLLTASLLAAAPAAADGAPVAGLRLGANLERWFPIARDGQARRLGRAWWQDFRAAGFDHARLFMPDVAQTGTANDITALYLQAAEDAHAAGLRILLGLADTYYHGSPWQAREWQALASRGAFLAQRTDPGRLVLAALNEPAFEDTATWLPVRDRMLATLRAAAPRHSLMWGGREWCSGRSLLECPVPADPNTIAEVHDYGGGGAAATRDRLAQVAAWRDRNRLPVVVSEMNGSGAGRADRAAWGAELRAALPVLRELRLPATLWSYSTGSWYRLQPDDGPAPYPDLQSLFR